MATTSPTELTRLRQMTAAQKLEVARGLWREAWRLKRASLARLHPDWSTTELDRATSRALSGGER
jgi:hypothetical protein